MHVTNATHSTARQRWTALVLLAAVEFMILLDTAIVNIATPAIQSGLHLSEADLPWIQNAYLLVFGGVLLLGGRAADLFGRKRLYLIGLGLFTVSSLLAGCSGSARRLCCRRSNRCCPPSSPTLRSSTARSVSGVRSAPPAGSSASCWTGCSPSWSAGPGSF